MSKRRKNREKPRVTPTKNGALAAALTLIPGAGHLYLGQKKKAAVAFITYPVTVFGAWHDARIMARRINERGSVGAWEFCWSHSDWSLVATRDLRTTEAVIGHESRDIDNAASDATVQRKLTISKEWFSTCTIEEERVHTTTETKEATSFRGRVGKIRIRGKAFRRSKTVEDTLRERFSTTEGEKHVHEEEVTINIGPRTRTRVLFRMKHHIQTGTVILEDQFKNTITAPFKIVTGMTFDQVHIDDAKPTA